MKSSLRWDYFDKERDLDAVLVLHAETEEAVGGAMELPTLDTKPVMECVVVLRDGVVIGGWYVEAVAEFVMFGTDPEATAFIQEMTPLIAQRMRARGLRGCRTFVPNWIGRSLESICDELKAAGFLSTDKHYRHFIFSLTGKAQVVPKELEEPASIGRCV